ncbi:hypothetical protein BLNAU_8631 [Blattamonas nauphoetae]|uniref:AIG1-type G domain-containing protein n=1 Tax=Blattamonas nauphoetae TaxID=2049346 RepID=A0ABQ9XY67_9EUKA|nr:hypothetical protein BLNAU_8631 [Blattamonas nauphoetae]
MSILLSKSEKRKLAAFGPTGEGKSKFLSMLYGAEVFTVGHGGNSETDLSVGLDCRIDEKKYRLIDTPGVADQTRHEQNHLDNIYHSLKNERYINAICVCIRVDIARVENSIQTTLRHLRNMFATPDIYKNLCLVFTRVEKQQQIDDFRTNKLEALNELIDRLFKDQRNKHGDIKMFWVDSAVKPDSTTMAEMKRLLAHVETLDAIPTTNINRLDAIYDLVTEEIIDEKSPGQPRPFMVTRVRDGLQEDPEPGELMPVTIHQWVRRLRQELKNDDESEQTIVSYQELGKIDEPWETVDDSNVRIFKKEFMTKKTFLGGTLQMQRNFDRNGSCIEHSPWKMIKDNTESLGSLVLKACSGAFLVAGTVVLAKLGLQ